MPPTNVRELPMRVVEGYALYSWELGALREAVGRQAGRTSAHASRASLLSGSSLLSAARSDKELALAHLQLRKEREIVGRFKEMKLDKYMSDEALIAAHEEVAKQDAERTAKQFEQRINQMLDDNHQRQVENQAQGYAGGLGFR